MRLAVCFLVIGLMAPMVINAAEDSQTEISHADLWRESGTLKDAIGRVYYGGTGTSVSVEMDIPAGQSILVGGDGADAFTMRLLDSEEQVGIVYLDSPTVRITNGPVAISGPGTVTVRAVNDGGYGVEVEWRA